VEGLSFRGKDEGLLQIRKALEIINAKQKTQYQASVAVLNAADFGVPQLRRRLFIVGARDGTRFQFPAPTHFNPTEVASADHRCRWRTAWDALHDVPVPDLKPLSVRGKWAGLLPSIPEGQNYLWHTERGGGEPIFGWRRRFWSFLLKIAKDQPAWTLAAQPGPATGPFHWDNRRLSMREMARLQAFPDNLAIVGAIGDVQRQLGNAVPSLLAEVLAREIARQLLGHRVVGQEPRLAIPNAPTSPPPAKKVARVPKRYLDLRGNHAAHPGTGKGYRASARSVARQELQQLLADPAFIL
jgi:DNA (cytosine-5)-methyltransferase 1